MRSLAATLLLAALAMTANAATSPSDRDAVLRGNTAFALDLYRREAALHDGNVFFSPYSISTAMAMVGAGARGATAKEIESALHLPFGGARLAQAWSAVLDDVNRHDAGYDLVTANALWAAKDVEFRRDYLETARKDFAATIERLDFAHAAAAARKRINDWVSEATRKKIETIVGEDSVRADTLLVLTNAIYMKAPWATPFSPRATDAAGTFHAAGGDMKASMMRQTDHFRFARANGVRVIELPYARNELSMLIVLPEAKDGLAAVEKTLTPESIAAWEKQLAPRRVAVTLPRFKTEMSFELVDVLKAMGIRLAFDRTGAGDFSGISTTEKLAISRVIHKARVDVSEEGTEAAAATAVVAVRATAIMHTEPPEVFNADHPFVYVIRRGGNVLFVGRLAKP